MKNVNSNHEIQSKYFNLIFNNFPFLYSFGSENKKNTLSVKANETLEWFQNEKKLVAIGKVKIKIDSRSIFANKVTVFYGGYKSSGNSGYSGVQLRVLEYCKYEI